MRMSLHEGASNVPELICWCIFAVNDRISA